MMDEKSPIRVIKALPALGIAVAGFATALALDVTIFPGHLRIVFVSLMMCGIAIYSCIDVMHKPHIRILVTMYVLLHVFVIGILPPDDAYYGAVLIPFAIFDYISFVYVAYFVLNL